MTTMCTYTSFLLVAIATCVHSQDTSTTANAPTLDGADVKLDEPCTTWNSSADYDKLISRFYGKLFHTKEQIERQEQTWREEHKSEWGVVSQRKAPALLSNRWSDSMGHDYDQCCPTVMYYDKKKTKKNTRGQWRTIMHLPLAAPPRFQWYPNARCGPGNCLGKCRLENIAICLLVYPLSGPLFPPEFDWFYVPGYCSCKSS
ncbi:uncharacterized protein LOC124131153 isoform X2 [Haliotis rufescens]|uniref:uncharacterized protein LOC124131153 isoform X2 n=1 Tax=Haliotis rufescens TaxID=6454 RepID=UPI00201F7633|nr:uncharacterized protein LOC124131153 isoform X2 [Haliotis rufescens]